MAVIQMKWTDFHNPGGIKETFTVPGDITQADATALCIETLEFYNSSRINPNEAARTFVSAEILPDDHPDAANAYPLDPKAETDPADEPDEDDENLWDEDDSDLDDSEVLFDDEDIEDGEDEW